MQSKLRDLDKQLQEAISELHATEPDSPQATAKLAEIDALRERFVAAAREECMPVPEDEPSAPVQPESFPADRAKPAEHHKVRACIELLENRREHFAASLENLPPGSDYRKLLIALVAELRNLIPESAPVRAK